MATRYDPDASFEIRTWDVEFRRTPSRQLMARVYQPQGIGPFPVVLDLHGGAWNNKDRFANVPMDEALLRAAFDLSGRSSLCFRVEVPGVYTPTIDLTVLEGFWKAFCDGVGANLHVDMLQGRDYHHVVEAMFKAAGRALRAATRPDGTNRLPSTKELIDV